MSQFQKVLNECRPLRVGLVYEVSPKNDQFLVQTDEGFVVVDENCTLVKPSLGDLVIMVNLDDTSYILKKVKV